MSKNFRKRRDKRWKKKAKRKASLLSSSGGESEHYISQSIYRSGSLKPIRKKVIKRKIKNGYIGLKKLTNTKVLITNYRTGDEQVVAKNLKGGVTFLDTS